MSPIKNISLNAPEAITCLQHNFKFSWVHRPSFSRRYIRAIIFWMEKRSPCVSMRLSLFTDCLRVYSDAMVCWRWSKGINFVEPRECVVLWFLRLNEHTRFSMRSRDYGNYLRWRYCITLQTFLNDEAHESCILIQSPCKYILSFYLHSSLNAPTMALICFYIPTSL